MNRNHFNFKLSFAFHQANAIDWTKLTVLFMAAENKNKENIFSIEILPWIGT